MKRSALSLLLLAGSGSEAGLANSTVLSGGTDLRAQLSDGEDFWGAESVFLNARQVFAHNGADRWILVLQADGTENFQHVDLYQSYAQLKGPLGRWNLRAGRLVVPFGLLSSYDSERLLLNTPEPLTLGLKLDEGLALLGYAGDYDYAFAITEGTGDFVRPVLSARVGLETSEISVGLSLLAGRLPETASKLSVESSEVLEDVPLKDKYRLGVDATWSNGPQLWRMEAVLGTDSDDAVGGLYAEYERALDADWMLGANLGIWDGAALRWRGGAYLGRKIAHGAQWRAGFVHEDEEEGREQAFVVQLYWEHSRAL